MQRARELEPVVRRLGTVREEGARGRCVARHDVHNLLERRVAELGEPEAELLDDVDGEPVAARRDRRAQHEPLPQPLTRRDGTVERGAATVPDDRVAALVEPVVRDEEPVLRTARPPRRRARVLELDRRLLDRAGLDGCVLECVPAHDEGGRGSSRRG